jgi:hypothetical protein
VIALIGICSEKIFSFKQKQGALHFINAPYRDGDRPMENKLRNEYDLKTLKVRKMGADRRKFGDRIIRLGADVAEVFTSAELVNEALRFLITITKDNQNKIQDLLVK